MLAFARDLPALRQEAQGLLDELLAYRSRGAWHDVRSDDINAFIKARTGGAHSATSYIDPRVIDAYEGGTVIDLATLFAVDDDPADAPTIHRRAMERAVLRLLGGHEAGRGLRQVAA